jgi:hypothetical protein
MVCVVPLSARRSSSPKLILGFFFLILELAEVDAQAVFGG